MKNKPVKKSEIRNIQKTFHPKERPTLAEWLKQFNKNNSKNKKK